jgi:hypothetical protein
MQPSGSTDLLPVTSSTRRVWELSLIYTES